MSGIRKMKKTKKQRIIGTQKYINNETGEIIETLVIEKNIEQDFNFYKVWLNDLLNVLEVVGNKKLKVIKWILNNIDPKTNRIVTTHEEIAKELGITRVVVSQTFKQLIDNNFIKKIRNGLYMVNPDIIIKGNSGKRQNLLIRYIKGE
jgi:predicted transcriptional regulator